MAQTVVQMLAELTQLQQTESWLTAQAFAEFKQAEALQSIAEVLRVPVSTKQAVDDMRGVPLPKVTRR